MTVAHFLLAFGIYTPTTHIVSLAMSKGLTEETASTIVVWKHFGQIIGSPIAGFLGERFPAKIVHAMNIFLCGFISVLSFLYDDFPTLLMYSLIDAFFFESVMCLLQLVLTIYCPHNSVKVSGFVVTLMCPGALLGPPIAGWMFEAFDSYDIPFITIGLAVCISAIPVLILKNEKITQDIDVVEFSVAKKDPDVQ